MKYVRLSQVSSVFSCMGWIIKDESSKIWGKYSLKYLQFIVACSLLILVDTAKCYCRFNDCATYENYHVESNVSTVHYICWNESSVAKNSEEKLTLSLNQFPCFFRRKKMFWFFFSCLKKWEKLGAYNNICLIFWNHRKFITQ